MNRLETFLATTMALSCVFALLYAADVIEQNRKLRIAASTARLEGIAEGAKRAALNCPKPRPNILDTLK